MIRRYSIMLSTDPMHVYIRYCDNRYPHLFSKYMFSLAIEYPPTGGGFPFSKFRTLKLLRYVTTMDHFVLICEVRYNIRHFFISSLFDISSLSLEFCRFRSLCLVAFQCRESRKISQHL